MLVLGLDTATSAVGAAVVEVDDRTTTRAWLRTVDPRAHAELLGPQIRAVLREAGAGPADLAAIVAGTGPGPFTGLRVGLATAAAMGQALGIPTYGVCTLDAIAAEVAGSLDGRTLVATDARRREIYWAVYDRGERVSEPAVDLPAVVAKEATRLGAEVAVGEGAHRYAADLALPVPDEPRYPHPAALVTLAADRVRAGAPGERLVPRYLRRPDVAAPRPPKPATPTRAGRR